MTTDYNFNDVEDELDESKLRICAYCGDDFYADRPDRIYCPEKYGKKNYCKQEQKKLVNENKLAEMVEKLSMTAAPIRQDESSFDRSIGGLETIMQDDATKYVTGDLLDRYQVNLNDLQYRTTDSDGNQVIVLGNYQIMWIEYQDTIFKFKITKHEPK